VKRIIALMSQFNDDVFKLLGIHLTEAQLVAFATYERELIDWNQRFNLTAITDPDQIRIKHFLDSLSCWLGMPQAASAQVIDVGAGAGFPGIPLKILQPEMRLTLVEATAKKASFIEHIVQVLGLPNVSVLTKRAEDAGQMPEHRETYDWVIARALAPMPVLAEYLFPFAKVGGSVLAQKGKDARQEIETAKAAFEKLGGELKEIIPVNIPGLEEERYLVVVKKIVPTPATYPRRAGMPSKRPL
jgi:16S rRNA (guanine527-N7)-methyltransferase